MFKKAIFTCAFTAILTNVLPASVPNLLNYQGSLTDPAGVPVADGKYAVTFTIYDVPQSPPGTVVWTETQSIISVNGSFSVLLGSVNALTDTVFNVPSCYLGIKIESDPELEPLIRLTTAPYAHRLSTVDGASGGQISGELDVSESAFLASDTVVGFRSTANNFGPGGNVVGGYFKASGLDAGGSPLGAGVLAEAYSDGFDLIPIGLYGRGINSSGGSAYGARLEGTHGAWIEASRTGVYSVVNSSGFAFGTRRYTSSSAAFPSYGSWNSVTSNGGDAIGFYSSTRTTSPGVEYGGYFKTSSQFSDATKYGTYIEAEGGDGFVTYGNYTDITRENQGITYGEYNKVDFLNGGSGTGYASFNFAQRSSTAAPGTLYGSLCRAWNYNLANTSSTYGVYAYGFSAATSGTVYGIYAIGLGGSNSYAGYFSGNVHVTGVLSKAGGSFKIDHPLDPENKFLQHSFVESPDMKNIYDGNVTLDSDGVALVSLPEYFETLNMEFRYQLTSIGAPGPNLYISEKIEDNKFKIAGGVPFSEVSWQVTGVRQDKWANENRIKVELDKTGDDIGRYLHAKAHGQPETRSIDHENRLKADSPKNQVDN